MIKGNLTFETFCYKVPAHISVRDLYLIEGNILYIYICIHMYFVFTFVMTCFLNLRESPFLNFPSILLLLFWNLKRINLSSNHDFHSLVCSTASFSFASENLWRNKIHRSSETGYMLCHHIYPNFVRPKLRIYRSQFVLR